MVDPALKAKFFSSQMVYLLYLWLLYRRSLRNSAEGIGVQGPEKVHICLVSSYAAASAQK